MINKQELFNTIWKACEKFRGKIDSSKYKDYILSMLFIKYISDVSKYENEVNERDNKGVSKLLNKTYKIDDKSNFDYLFKIRNDDNLGQLINDVVSKIEEDNRNSNISGALSLVDFNDKELGETGEKNKALRGLIDVFKDSKLDFSPSKIDSDILGDVYEYLIASFASDAGKKGGEFYTPSEVSTLMAMLIRPDTKTTEIYDPTCGSGSLLIKVAKQITLENGKISKNISLKGQEINMQTEKIARMNMIIHNITNSDIKQGNTLIHPKFKNHDGLDIQKFDIVVANPPFSLNISDDITEMENDTFGRYKYGLPPKNRGDFAFVQHMVASLKSDGRMITVLPEGPMFRGASEGRIREQLIKNNLIEGVIKLPSNLFFGTGISSVLLIINKQRTFTRNKKNIFIINASEEYVKSKNQNKLTEKNIKKIFGTYENKVEIKRFSSYVTLEKIVENNYSLNVTTYVDNSEPEIEYDLDELKQTIEKLRSDISKGDKKLFELLKKEGIY